MGLIDKIKFNRTIGDICFEQSSGNSPPGHLNGKSDVGGANLYPRLVDVTVRRHDDQTAMAARGQFNRQGSAHIGKSSRFGEGNSLAGKHDNVQSSHPTLQIHQILACGKNAVYRASPTKITMGLMILWQIRKSTGRFVAVGESLVANRIKRSSLSTPLTPERRQKKSFFRSI
jgi:hypothetical protein